MNGKEIERHRLEHRLSQREISEVVGCTPKTIGNWENSVGSPNPIQVEKLRKLFGLDIENEVKSFTVKLVQQLLDDKIIDDANTIPQEIIDMIIAALKLDIKNSTK